MPHSVGQRIKSKTEWGKGIIMKILIFGGDGYIGWPLALKLANNHDVTIFDNLSKRKWVMECGISTLFETYPIHRRASAYNDETGNSLSFNISDGNNCGAVYSTFDSVNPDVVIDCSSQGSAPFSMKNRTNASLTFQNNINSLINILHAVKRSKSKPRLIKLQGISKQSRGESFSHLSNESCSKLVRFASTNWNMSVTLAEVGIVYGIETEETKLDPLLQTTVYYDGVFGTLINRLCVESVVNHPLTVYRPGEVKRYIINLEDLVKSIDNIISSPNQVSEVLLASQVMSVIDIAKVVESKSREFGYNPKIKKIDNPRIHENELVSLYSPNLGLSSFTSLEETLNAELFTKLENVKGNVDISTIPCDVKWDRHI